MRLFGAALILLAMAVLSGCPQPINDETTTGGNKLERDTVRPAAGEVNRESEADAGGGAVAGGDSEAAIADSGEAETGEVPPAEDESAESGDEKAAGEPDAAGTITFPGRKPAAKPAQPAGEPEQETQDVLDPATLLGDAADKPAKRPEPAPPLDAEARAFSGSWAVIVVNQDGYSRLAQSDNEWVFQLAADGLCTVSRELNGVASAQSGRWEYDGSELALKLGPAQRAYSVEQPRADVALFTDEMAKAVLFCLRIDPGQRAPMLKASYQLGGSELRFKSAGPGGHWRGTLTEPECSLLVRPVGNFVAGSWETPQDEGYVLLELSEDGFDGWWWYSESIEFDGIWISGEK